MKTGYTFPNHPINADFASIERRVHAHMTNPHTPQEVLDRVMQDTRTFGVGAYYIAPEDIYGTAGIEVGWLFRPGSLWIGAHYSPTNRRWYINLLPMVTVWICLKGGVRP